MELNNDCFVKISGDILTMMIINQKGISLPILFVVIVVTSLIAYIVANNTSLFKNTPDFVPATNSPAILTSPTPQPTQNSDSTDPSKPGYKLYTNNEAGYQINYPEKWSRNQVYNYYDLDDDLIVMNYTDQPRGLGFLDGEIQLSVGHIKKSAENSGFAFTEFDKNLKDPIGSANTNKVSGKLTKVENIEIANNTGIKFTYIENYEGAIYGLVHHFKANHTIFFINFFAPDKQTMDKYQREINEAIGSFRLLSS